MGSSCTLGSFGALRGFTVLIAVGCDGLSNGSSRTPDSGLCKGDGDEIRRGGSAVVNDARESSKVSLGAK